METRNARTGLGKVGVNWFVNPLMARLVNLPLLYKEGPINRDPLTKGKRRLMNDRWHMHQRSFPAVVDGAGSGDLWQGRRAGGWQFTSMLLASSRLAMHTMKRHTKEITE